jgi:hypothetical protein
MKMQTWKSNWAQSRQNYIDWWAGKGTVITLWEACKKEGAPHVEVPPLPAFRDYDQLWFDPSYRAEQIHHFLATTSLKGDILPVANTQLGPGSLAAILGARLEAREDTIWIRQNEAFDGTLKLDPENRWWKLHLDLLKACKAKARGQYFVGCPDLMEGLDVLASIRGNDNVLMDIMLDPDGLEAQVQRVNEIYFEVFDQIYDILREGGEMAFCYFSIWAPGKCSKFQSDISVMISEEDFRRFVQPYLREQCRRIPYSLYHLDGVDAIRHLDAVLEIKELKAVQWTPGYGQPQGGNACWFDLYKRVKAAGKSVIPCWVTLDELKPLLDEVGPEGLNVEMDIKNENEFEQALRIAEAYGYKP